MTNNDDFTLADLAQGAEIIRVALETQFKKDPKFKAKYIQLVREAVRATYEN